MSTSGYLPLNGGRYYSSYSYSKLYIRFDGKEFSINIYNLLSIISRDLLLINGLR